MFSSIEGGIYGAWQINPGSIRSSSKVKVIILIYNNIISEANKLPSGRRTVCRLHCLPDSFLIVYISRCILSSLSCSVSFVIAPILFVCRSRLAGTYFLNHCSDYSLYVVFKYRLHWFITYQTFRTHYLDRINKKASSSLFPARPSLS